MNIERLIIFFIFGLAFGPILSILVDRAVERLNPEPELRCSSCKKGAGLKSLIPVYHWFLKCSGCSKSLGVRYLFTDLLAAGSMVLAAGKFDEPYYLIPFMLFFLVLAALSVIDVETHLLPNIIVWPSIWISLVLVGLLSFIFLAFDNYLYALLGAVIFSGFLFISFLVYPKGMGLGDVKLAIFLGLYIGWLQDSTIVALTAVLYALVIASVLGGVLGLLYNFIMKKGRSEIPFGPFLVAGSLVVIMAS